MPSRRRYLAALGTAGSVGGAGCLGTLGVDGNGGDDEATGPASDDTDWPTVGRDSRRSSHAPDARVPADPAEAWSVEVSRHVGLAAAGDAVLLASWDGVTALDAATGDRLWRAAPADDGTFHTVPTVHDGTVYVGSDRGLVTLDPRTGERRWAVDLPEGVLVPPAVGYDGESLLVAGGHTVAEVELADRSVRWTTEVAMPVSQPLTYFDGSLFVGAEGGELYGLTPAAEGHLSWRQKLPGRLFGAPAAGPNDWLYVDTNDGYVHAVSPNRAGGVVWSSAERAASSGTLAVAHTTAYVAGAGGVMALDAYDGTTRWRAGEGFFCPPVLAGETLCVGDERGGVVAFDASNGTLAGVGGRQRWRHQHGGRVRRLVAAGGRLFGATEPAEGEPTLFALE
ncbi:PQQ-binding-like beta-propeller repeat protein [Halobium salinum]|uniref:PQQ-binding-like beta-propeller repeat protein n=1 Tax=Halobium salinum TaxID=1364940 RepID=A0ABD5P9I9_9EURY|nr:PQQ-binding-like beta-propeller repeat protein [Halobium salinum]